MAAKTFAGLQVRKLADRSGERPVDPDTGELGAWPFAGLQVEGDPPPRCTVPTSFVATGVGEGWIVLEGERVEHAPGGPPGDEWRVTHTFREADVVVLKTVDGDVRYRVVAQPGKYTDKAEPGGARVDWFYRLELER